MTPLLLAAALLLPAGTPFEPPPLAEVSAGAIASAPAVRLDPPTPPAPPPPEEVLPAGSSDSAGGRCVGWEPLLAAASPGWDVARMSRIAYRESRCLPGSRNGSSTATGLLQLLASHCPWLARQMGTWCSRDRLTDPTFNIAAAAVLWREQGYGAWSTS
jgi:hypothetical protein